MTEINLVTILQYEMFNTAIQRKSTLYSVCTTFIYEFIQNITTYFHMWAVLLETASTLLIL